MSRSWTCAEWWWKKREWRMAGYGIWRIWRNIMQLFLYKYLTPTLNVFLYIKVMFLSFISFIILCKPLGDNRRRLQESDHRSSAWFKTGRQRGLLLHPLHCRGWTKELQGMNKGAAEAQQRSCGGSARRLQRVSKKAFEDEEATSPALLVCLIVDKDVGVNDNDNEYQQ